MKPNVGQPQILVCNNNFLYFYIFNYTVKFSAKFLFTEFRAELLMNAAQSAQVEDRRLWAPNERETASRLKELRFYLSDDILVLTVYNCSVLCRRKM